ncbi:VOC family protein [Ruegeria lacuscaerulensis]|uniref:VOC family protein n=1 Tax=Ruegeria lacuscaerulensis TaxID=55218 RepID=UPI00147CCE07|nr:VOC family protein [Ruegeria lacuscaerulensis]
MQLYTTYGTNDLTRAIRFYDAIFSVLDQPRLPGWTDDRAGWGTEPETGIGFWICTPFNGAAASAGNGAMIAFPAHSAAQVRRFHATGLEHGGTDEGEPGVRGYYAPDFYVAYLRDPDGNKLSCFYYHYNPVDDPGD